MFDVMTGLLLCKGRARSTARLNFPRSTRAADFLGAVHAALGRESQAEVELDSFQHPACVDSGVGPFPG